MNIPEFKWNWTEFCGCDNLKIWVDNHQDLSYCFQLLCLQIPILSIIAIISAYYAGVYGDWIVRTSREKCILKFRMAVVLLLALMPPLELIILVYINSRYLFVIDYGLALLALCSWFVHFCYLNALLNRLGTNLKGPVILNSLWIMFYIVCLIRLRSLFLAYQAIQSDELLISLMCITFTVVLQTLYGFSLIPAEDTPSRRATLDAIDQEDVAFSSLVNQYVRFREDLDPHYLGTAMEGSSAMSRFLFLWVNPLMEKGSNEQLQGPNDVYDLPDSLMCSILHERVKRLADESTNYVSLIRTLHRCFAKEFYGVGILKFIADLAGFACPLLLHELLNFIDDQRVPLVQGYICAAGILLASIIASFCSVHFDFFVGKMNLKLQGALITTIYRKVLRLHSSVFRQISLGEIINHVSVDMERISNSCRSIHSLWSIPFQLVVTLYLLYTQVGIAFLSGVVCSVLLIPINKIIALKIGEYSGRMIEEKDKRVGLMSELIRGIRVIKLHVWEEYFVSKVFGVRAEEIKYLAYRKYLDGVCVYFWATTPVMISTLTFTVYLYFGGKLNAAIIFTSLALLNMLIGPLNAFPWVLNGVVEAWISVKRVDSFLQYDEVDFLSNYANRTNDDKAVVIQNGSFSWNSDVLHLNNINISITKGQLVGISGPVGSGKSTLLSVMLGEIQRLNGQIFTADGGNGIGFVSQTPWIQQCSVRDNILFDKPYEAVRYKTIIDACALSDDINLWPKGDLEIIGEGGSTLSGGQKARIALARAVYQNKSIYLLDDILSAVDRKVAYHIYQECVQKLLSGKTRIMVTHLDELFSSFDWIILMQNGTINEQGPGGTLVIKPSEKNILPVEATGEHFGESASKSRSASSSTAGGGGQELEKETSATGVVKLEIYSKYWKSVGHTLATLVLLSVVAMQISRVAVDWWLSLWVTMNTDANANITDWYYLTQLERDWVGVDTSDYSYFLTVYMALGVVNSVIVIIRAFSFALGGVRAAKAIHEELLSSVTQAQIEFFQVSPLGRILNRFSSDTNTVDDQLPFDINILLAQVASVLGILVTTMYGIPWLCIIIAPLIPVYHWLQNQYRMTSRDMKRIISVTMSPLYSHISETLYGLSTIRAFKESKRFIKENEEKVDTLQECQLTALAAQAWLNTRLQLIGVSLIGGVCMITVLQRHFDVAHSGFVGLAISYALTLTGSLGAALNIFVETERNMVALERVNEYIEDPKPEAYEAKVNIALPFAWPSQGVVSFSNVYMKYRNDAGFSLKNISFETIAGEKIGIVGRTGAGKSSLFSSLFRLNEIVSGSIHVDAINIYNVPLRKLRSKMTIIPQDPFIFSGTVRANLDPFEGIDEFEIWNAVNTCGLVPLIMKLGGMNAELRSDGANMSAGEKQLFCLVRAILKNSKIVCIDEATANMDLETDERIRDVIKNSFRGRTVFIIAHRVKSVMDCDRILVMGDGEVLEFDAPQPLLQNKESHFYKIVYQETHS